MDCEFRWYALGVKSQCEKMVSEVLRSKGFEEFLPQFWSRRIWSDRVKMIQMPLFPGYLFCRFGLAQRSSILETPGVFAIVGQGRKPQPVEGVEVEGIRKAVSSGQEMRPWPGLEVGRTVRIDVGPLRGLEGTLLRYKGESQLILQVKLLQRAVAVKVDESWVSPAGPIRPIPHRIAAMETLAG